jgi:hypothetical protein
MPNEIRREMVSTGISGSLVYLEPASANLEAQPAVPGLSRATLKFTSTPDSTYWTDGCAHFEVIVRYKTA